MTTRDNRVTFAEDITKQTKRRINKEKTEPVREATPEDDIENPVDNLNMYETITMDYQSIRRILSTNTPLG